ncbi:MAG TPA: hypothetical protein PLP83_09575 [Candidatus Aminicenantes bacterium]|nr:hypothetical protein [Candidatus Aminicenantes bacterium]
MFRENGPALPRLRYPTRTVRSGAGEVEEYIIPEEEKGLVLDVMYPFEPVPRLTETMFDLHEEKPFRVGEFRVVRGNAMDYLVSPYFFSSGGTVVDWMPADFKPGQTLARRIRGSEASVLTVSLGPRQTGH